MSFTSLINRSFSTVSYIGKALIQEPGLFKETAICAIAATAAMASAGKAAIYYKQGNNKKVFVWLSISGCLTFLAVESAYKIGHRYLCLANGYKNQLYSDKWFCVPRDFTLFSNQERYP